MSIDTSPSTLNHLLKERRQDLKLTRKTVAQESKINLSVISRIEGGVLPVSLENYLLIAELYGLPKGADFWLEMRAGEPRNPLFDNLPLTTRRTLISLQGGAGRIPTKPNMQQTSESLHLVEKAAFQDPRLSLWENYELIAQVLPRHTRSDVHIDLAKAMECSYFGHQPESDALLLATHSILGAAQPHRLWSPKYDDGLLQQARFDLSRKIPAIYKHISSNVRQRTGFIGSSISRSAQQYAADMGIVGT